MNRRNFLTFLGAVAAGAALPPSLVCETIARAPTPLPSWAKEVLRFSCEPLATGHHTFSAWAKKGGESWGLYIAGVTAKGGETILEVPRPGYMEGLIELSDPKVVKDGIQLDFESSGALQFNPGLNT
jgi:hypothetical protein